MSDNLFLDSFLNPPPPQGEVRLPEDIEALQSALRLSPLKKNDLKKFIQKEAAKLQISPDDDAQVFDPDSLESFQQNMFPLLKVLKKDAASETVDSFLHTYPFFADWEEFKGFLLACVAGRIEQKDHLFRALYHKTKEIEKTLKQLLHPPTKRDPVRTQIQQWVGAFQAESLTAETFHPDSMSPLGLVEHFLEYDEAAAAQATDLYLKAYHDSQLRKKQSQLLEAGLDQGALRREMAKYKRNLQEKKQEHYFTYGEITKIGMLKNNLATELDKLVEYLSRSFILALPDEVFSAKDKEILERSTHDGAFQAIG